MNFGAAEAGLLAVGRAKVVGQIFDFAAIGIFPSGYNY